ncbi:PLDc N-terminal domain-containing protein [Limibacter armeniacum]|uniref:PLDc N-terminal domain-containing protein n=1 Tax=Limibacter armeniacum TaxID=466084 RepID=UPI002FE5E798
MLNYILGFGMPMMFLPIFLIYVLPFTLWLTAIIDIVKSDFYDSTNKVVWTIVCFAPIVGPILYFSIGLKQKA